MSVGREGSWWSQLYTRNGIVHVFEQILKISMELIRVGWGSRAMALLLQLSVFLFQAFQLGLGIAQEHLLL